jgi:hypothetical protein
LKLLSEGGGIAGFKYLRYDTRPKNEQKMIEEALIEKMSKWHYDPNHFKGTIPEDLIKILNIKWHNTVTMEKDIQEQTLKEVLLSASNKEIKEIMVKYESRHTLRFWICQLLGNDIEGVVKATKIVWKELLKDRLQGTE